MTDTKAPERIWAWPSGDAATTTIYPDDDETDTDGLVEYIRADLATPAPREDGYSAGVRAAAAWFRERATDENGDLMAAVMESDLLESRQELPGTNADPVVLAPALPDARAGAVEPVAVRVKPLVWEGFVAGNYRIEVEKGGIANLWRYSAEMVENEEPDLVRGGYLTLVSLDELKAAAQADHEARILAALEITPACTATDGPASACVYRAPVECSHSHGRSANDRCLNCGAAM